MAETKIETKPVKPVPFEVFEEWPLPVQEFFELIARRPFELLETLPRTFNREFESWFKPEVEHFHSVYFKLYETEEALLLRAEVPGFTPRELEINVEPRKVIITGKKEYIEPKEYKEIKTIPIHKERLPNQIFRAVKLPVEIKVEAVKAILKDGVLELTLPKLEPSRKVRVEVKAA